MIQRLVFRERVWSCVFAAAVAGSCGPDDATLQAEEGGVQADLDGGPAVSGGAGTGADSGMISVVTLADAGPLSPGAVDAGRTDGGRAGASGSDGGTSRTGAGDGGSTTGSTDGGTDGSTGGSGVTPGGGLGLKNPPVPSAGCGKPTTVTTGMKTIRSGGKSREYTIDVPKNYDSNKPYRLFFTFHWIGSTDDAVVGGQVANGGADVWGYYGLKRQATMANEPAIFIAPQALNGMWGGPGDNKDHVFFDDMLAWAKTNLCVDTTRVFATGFSFGGMMSWSLSVNHQKDLRAVVGLAPANYNIYSPTKTHEPIPYMSTTGVGDTTCPWVQGSSQTNGAKWAALEHAKDNGCTIPANNDIPTAKSGSKTHLCYEFEGCKKGYPVRTCTFDGGHIAAHADGGTGDNGMSSWIPVESWKFFSQF